MPLYPNMPSRRRVPSAPEALGSGDVSVTADGRGGLAVRDGRPDAEWGRIASHVTANEYTALRLDDGDTAYPDRDALTVRCWEVSGSSGVAVGTKVRLEPNRAGEGYTFRAPATGGGSALTVQDVDGSPSVAGVTTLRFDAGDGFAITSPGAGVARVDLDGVPLGSGEPWYAAWWLEGTSPQRSLTTKNVYLANHFPANARQYIVRVEDDVPNAGDNGYGGVEVFHQNVVTLSMLGRAAWGAPPTGGSELSAAWAYSDEGNSIGVASGKWHEVSGSFVRVGGTNHYFWIGAVQYQSSGSSGSVSGYSSLGADANVRLGAAAYCVGNPVSPTLGVTGAIGPGAQATGGIVTDLGTAVSPPPPPPPAGQPPPYLDPGGDWNYPLGSEQGSKAAAGSNQSGATEITDLTTEVTGADGTKGVRLPDAPGPRLIWQSSSSALAIYPPTGGKINGGVTDAAVTFTAIGGWRALFWRLNATDWWYMLFG